MLTTNQDLLKNDSRNITTIKPNPRPTFELLNNELNVRVMSNPKVKLIRFIFFIVISSLKFT